MCYLFKKWLILCLGINMKAVLWLVDLSVGHTHIQLDWIHSIYHFFSKVDCFLSKSNSSKIILGRGPLPWQNTTGRWIEILFFRGGLQAKQQAQSLQAASRGTLPHHTRILSVHTCLYFAAPCWNEIKIPLCLVHTLFIVSRTHYIGFTHLQMYPFYPKLYTIIHSPYRRALFLIA